MSLKYSLSMIDGFLIYLGIELSFILKICLCFLAGLAIGYERESMGKDAGISTHSLVILGAMLFTFMSINIEPDNTGRIAAAVVTGIGFLGAGVILKNGTGVHNLTTAASLWFSASIGMAFGFGLYTIGIIATLVAIPILRLPHLAHPKGWVKEEHNIQDTPKK